MEQEVRRRTVVSYVQRGGRMTVGQERAWERHWSQLGQDVSGLAAGPVDTTAWFGRSAPVVLEIGSGMGETTSKLAAAAPEVNYLAVEVYQAGLAQLMMRAADLGVTNLRLLRGDAVILLTEHIEPGTLSEVRLYFPDPWPKKRHHKRRIVQPDFVSLVASRLAPGGRFHMATDWEHYAEHMLEVCSAETALRNVYSGWAPRPEWRPVTKFESRAHTEGRNIRDLIFERAHAL
nr:tRNA (guanosine(46)-N7)-methyltransferase TrmB [Kibdelosporangium sp. MJ126-NF4]CEL15919.1 tRNA (guanine46-N7-)-methyltransferase [Kibdelosporangium sp. MJ126-NF4]CTQ93843.1 tRNA (guanine46-N7-)-methyltransferase (EC 2.1.1.33) [Kibdelosporangium sp. MJ126-NF4]